MTSALAIEARVVARPLLANTPTIQNSRCKPELTFVNIPALVVSIAEF